MRPRLTEIRSKARQRIRRVKATIRHAALTHAPLWLSGGRLRDARSVTHVSRAERTIDLPRLPDALDGLRIAHLTDLHVGAIFTPARLPAIVSGVNDLAGDIIAVTGDFVDLSLNVLDDVIDAMRQLAAPLGVYFVPGNHDYLEDGQKLIDRFKDAGLRMLMNESVAIEHRGARLIVAGIDYPHQARQMKRLVLRALRSAPPRRDGDARLLLSHHPNAFNIARQRHVDLTLAGHTHGGQVVFSNKRGKKGSIGFASLAHRYPRGLYRHGDSFLYVNSGVGTFFPLRINCPAEIACLTLKASPGDTDERHDRAVSHP